MRVACIYFENQNKTEAAIKGFTESCLRFTPQIALQGERAVFLEIGKSKTLYKEDVFLLRVQTLLNKFNLAARLAIEDNLPRALVKAKYGTSEHTELPLESLSEFVDPYQEDVDQKKLLSKMIENFNHLGIKSIAQFASLPSAQIPSRYGALGVLCHQRIRAQSAVFWKQWKAPERISEALELAYDDYCNSLEPLLFKSKTILDRIFARLRGRGTRLTRIKVKLSLEQHSFVKKPFREWNFDLMAPLGTTQALLPILQERFSRDLSKTPLESCVLGIYFTVEETTPGQELQKNLFHSREDHEEMLHSVMGQLGEALGKECVFRAATLESRLPEKSWTKKDSCALVSKAEPAENLAQLMPFRPSRLLKKPQKIEVTKEKVFLKKRSFEITLWSGVERISENWLEGSDGIPEARDYYQVEIKEGPPLWIFQDPEGTYFLHGYFE